jgi:hypothetical protein
MTAPRVIDIDPRLLRCRLRRLHASRLEDGDERVALLALLGRVAHLPLLREQLEARDGDALPRRHLRRRIALRFRRLGLRLEGALRGLLRGEIRVGEGGAELSVITAGADLLRAVEEVLADDAGAVRAGQLEDFGVGEVVVSSDRS